MATLGTENPTLADLAKVTDPDGSIADVIEILTQTNEILEDMTWLEGNLTTGHRTSMRSGLPSPTFRKMYGFVQPTKSRAVQVTDNCGMMEDYSQVDKALVDMAGNPAAFRLQEDRPHIEGMNQTLATKLFYGDESTAPEEFTGFVPRFNSLSAENGDNIINGGGSGSDNGSIWLVCWSPNTCHGIIPKGSKAGIQQRDLGEVTVQDAAGSTSGLMQAYRTHYRCRALCPRLALCCSYCQHRPFRLNSRCFGKLCRLERPHAPSCNRNSEYFYRSVRLVHGQVDAVYVAPPDI